MTRCANLQIKAAKAMKKALESKDQNLKRFFYNASKGFEKRLEKLTVQQASEEV